MDRTIVNFTRTDSGSGTLMRAVPKVDPGTDGTQQWDIDLVFGVDEVQAQHMAPALPQAGEYLARARDGKASATITVRPVQRDIHLTLHGVLDELGAEIRQLRMQLTEKAQSYTARLRLYALTPEQGGALVAHLGKALRVSVRPAQLDLPLDGPVVLGSIVVGSDGFEDVFGVLTKRVGEQYIVEDFGVVHTIGSIGAAITLQDGWQAAAERYSQRMVETAEVPSWRALVTALGAVGDGSTLSKEVVDYAIEMQLPAEVGLHAQN